MIVVYPDAAFAALEVLYAALPDFTLDYVEGVQVGADLPANWTRASGGPFVRCEVDAAFTDWVLVEDQTVRTVVFHRTASHALALAQLCRGILVDHSGTTLRRVRALTGPMPAIDDTNEAPIASFTVSAVVRSADPQP